MNEKEQRDSLRAKFKVGTPECAFKDRERCPLRYTCSKGCGRKWEADADTPVSSEPTTEDKGRPFPGLEGINNLASLDLHWASLGKAPIVISDDDDGAPFAHRHRLYWGKIEKQEWYKDMVKREEEVTETMEALRKAGKFDEKDI